jgi:hypothetical protein
VDTTYAIKLVDEVLENRGLQKRLRWSITWEDLEGQIIDQLELIKDNRAEKREKALEGEWFSLEVSRTELTSG